MGVAVNILICLLSGSNCRTMRESQKVHFTLRFYPTQVDSSSERFDVLAYFGGNAEAAAVYLRLFMYLVGERGTREGLDFRP